MDLSSDSMACGRSCSTTARAIGSLRAATDSERSRLYYFHEGDTFGFASELPALRQHPKVSTEISRLSLKKYFAYCYIPAPRSIYERVWKLPGGHSLSLDLSSNELKTWRYWSYVLKPTPMCNTRATAVGGKQSVTAVEITTNA
jgi:asparagine synthetase B (glutamine-hydrolysing)